MNYVSIPASEGTRTRPSRVTSRSLRLRDSRSPTSATRDYPGWSARPSHQNTEKEWWIDKTFDPPLTHGRNFTKDELWRNYPYFIKQVVPVAKETGIRSEFSPDDPPCARTSACAFYGPRTECGKYMGKDVFEAA